MGWLLYECLPSQSPEEDAGGGPEVEGSTGGVGVHGLVQEALIFSLLADEAP